MGNVILFFEMCVHMQMVRKTAELVGYSTDSTLNCHLNKVQQSSFNYLSLTTPSILCLQALVSSWPPN